jgi:hypothetical protein
MVRRQDKLTKLELNDKIQICLLFPIPKQSLVKPEFFNLEDSVRSYILMSRVNQKIKIPLYHSRRDF